MMKSGTVQNGCSVEADCYIGDPSMSYEVAVEQYRQEYIFLAPEDFAFNWADVMVPNGANVQLDGAALGGTPEVVTQSKDHLRGAGGEVAAGFLGIAGQGRRARRKACNAGEPQRLSGTSDKPAIWGASPKSQTRPRLPWAAS